MPRMPGVAWVPANDGNSRLAMAHHDIVCVHTIVGHDPAVAAHFSTGSDGLITQSRDTNVQSAANFYGNPRVIAIENEDFGPEYGSWAAPNVPRFTAPQAEAIAAILVWACQTHGIPLELCPDSKPTSRGVAYHRQGIDGNWAGFAYGGRVPGGEIWSTSTGKSCPGDQRITQLINEIIPRARVLAGLEQGKQQSQQQEDDVPYGTFKPAPDPTKPGHLNVNVDRFATSARFDVCSGWTQALVSWEVYCVNAAGGYTNGPAPYRFGPERADRPNSFPVPAGTAALAINYVTAPDNTDEVAWRLFENK